MLADFEDYLNGFSPNVQDILENFKFRNQLSTLSKADALGTLISKFLDPEIDLTPAGIDNHSMGTVFEELVRKFNEENNEEADDDLFRKFSKIADALEKRLDEWGADAEESNDEEGAKKKGMPEKIKRKLLDSKTWERDGRLVDTATRLREEIGGKLFEDHNVFREKVFAGLWKLVIKLPAALFPEFSGVSNGHSTVCNARIQAVYDRISGKIIDFSIDPYSKNDLAAAPEREIMEGDLVLRDRGYLSNCRRDPETP